eukprot:TRINITY_DN12347_c0_g1_i1.p1 TRINITY_DN12347_c0_g1~~TRINITY_DN12347_c0_g1_i1.p1  ORF type:complete len:363 (+),score=72.91 TRINITY_DN12347_c0_g1_i1:221-1309(+)
MATRTQTTTQTGLLTLDKVLSNNTPITQVSSELIEVDPDLPVVVTGASGYVAGEVIFQLIQNGYQVRGTVRDLNNHEKVEHLRNNFKDLHLFQADLMDKGSFDAVCEGAGCVIHTASPFQLNIEDPQRDLIDPALEGTRNVLDSCVKHKDTVRVVVVTSSGAAVVKQFHEYDESKIWDENDFNDNSTLENGPYRLSKYLAESLVWKYANQHLGIRFSTINPTFVLGAPHSNRLDSTSVKLVKALVDGTSRSEGGPTFTGFGNVDVRDVGLAHVRAMENPRARGRFIVSSEVGIPKIKLVEYIREVYPNFPLPDSQRDADGSVTRYSRMRARKELGMEFIHPRESILNMVEFMIKNDIVTYPQ